MAGAQRTGSGGPEDCGEAGKITQGESGKCRHVFNIGCNALQCKLRCFNILQERKEKNQLPSEDEVRARLDRLKGVPHSEKGAEQQQAQFYRPPDTRTSTEQVNHLVSATSAKVVITDACISEGIHGCWYRSTLRHVMSYSVLKRTLLDALPG